MKGEIIVRHGEKIGPGHMTKLRALWNTELVKFNGIRFTGILLTSLIVSGGLFFSPSGKAMGKIEQKELLFIGFVIVFFTILAKVFAIVGAILAASSPYFPIGAHVYALPVAGATLMLTTFSARRYFITSMLLSLFCTLAANGNLPLFLFYFLSALFGSWITNKAQNRKEIVKALPKLLCALIPLWCATSMYQNGETANMGVEFMAVLLGSFLSLILTFAMPPLIEIIFGFTTKFSLLELMNQEHPVLRQLMLDAPGTYHHCLVVSNMAELAAKAMDANSLLCKVGALYHDIGKVEKPLYFIENQFRGINPHDNLSPTMSALVLISHVKSGAELATQAHLGKEIIDIIQEHHGTRLVQYFYQKALSANIKVQVEDFCYPGPKPSSTESAIIMLADVIEASSRTLDNPTPSRIKAHVHRMIRVILAEGQLANVEMSFRDLDRLEESFTLILTGMFHKRIEYPGKHPVKAASDTAPGAVPSASSTSLGTSPGTSTSTSPDASPNASPKTSPDASPKVSPETLPETTNAAAAGSMPGHTEIPSHQLPVQPMEFKPHVSKLDKAQMEKEQLRINIRDYNDAKWLNLEENVHEITILNNNLALLSDQKDLQKK
jgi:putative nucleotidyltransferase with HDIG domain